MSDFLITGPSTLSLGDTVRVSFTIRNGGTDVINLTDKGVFAAVRDGEGANKDLGPDGRNAVLQPDDIIEYEETLTLDERGLWIVWPSYEIWKTAYSAPLGHYITLKVKGPDNWNACEVPICPDYCEDGTHYYAGYMGQEDCIYEEEECGAGCDGEGIACNVADTTAPEVSITSSPPEPSTASRITFTAIATDNGEVGTIRIIVDGRTVEECELPQHFERDDYWQCAYTGGPYAAGILGYYAEAEDGAGNVGVSEEKEIEISGLVIPEEPIIPEEEHPMQCTISGVLYNFSYYSKTLGVRVCQAQKIGGCLSRPPYTCAASTVVCKEGGTSWNASITRLWAGEERRGEPGPMRYAVTLPCDGMYLITPENREYGDECAWMGRWVAKKANSFFINASDLEGFDFTFAPLEKTGPVIMLQIIAGAPPAGSFEAGNYTLSVGATDANGIARITMNGSDVREFFQSNESGPLQYSRPNQTQALYKSCSSSPCNISLQNVGEKSRTVNLKISVCDGAGNKEEIVYNHTIPQGNGDLEVLSVEPVQVLYRAPLVKGKNTAFRVRVRSTFAYPVETRFGLALPESEWDKLPMTGGGSISPPAGWGYPESWGPVLIPAGAEGFEIILPVMPDWKKDYPFSFTDNPNGIIDEMVLGNTVWPKARVGPKPKADSVSFAVDADPENKVSEVNEGNNHASANASVVTTKAWKFCFVPDSFSLRRSPDEYMSSYEHYLHQQGYADVNDRMTDVLDWESRQKSGYAPLSMALSEADIERMRGVSEMYIEYLSSVYPMGEGKVSYKFMDDYLYFVDDYIIRNNPDHRLCPTYAETEENRGKYYGTSIMWFRNQMKAQMVETEGCDFVVLINIFGCCGQASAGYGEGLAQIESGYNLNGSPWRHTLYSYNGSTDLGLCHEWGYGMGGAAENVLAHEFNHAELNFTSECYGCYPGYGNNAFCGDCLADEGFSVLKWKEYPKGEWRSGYKDGNYYRFAEFNGTSYLADAVRMGSWTRLEPSRIRENGTEAHGGYLHALDRFASPADPSALIVRGHVSKDGSGGFEPFIFLENSTIDGQYGGKYRIVLLGAGGEELGSFAFSPTFEILGEPPMSTDKYYFSYRVEWKDGAKRIELRDGSGNVVASREVSVNKPSVRLVYPNGGEIFGVDGEYNIRWEASDADGDALTYSVAISSDGGKNWRPIGFDLGAKELAFSTFGFEEGSEYLVRVRASDGVNGAEDVSDGMFAISSTAPPPAQPGPESYLVVGVVLVALALGLVIWMKLKPGK